ncbi:hypothetical protein RF11_12313 [Thelohanellus kitauei]|uniref:Tc1-like transposase DDE domain-containing protein n=1 Tax=Thelohanellus kitauei TaxID=669202 RepID=A0A0C2JU86_THEKT|nr:hypothetical protein RF11_12313 [Thelohanellus kitauei]
MKMVIDIYFKVNEEIITFIRELNLDTRFDITSSETTIHNCLGQMPYILKAFHIITTRRNNLNAICIRNHFATSFLQQEENYPTSHEICYVPPYSPFLNPFEELFSKWKLYVKSPLPENEIELFNCMTQDLTTLTRVACDGYYRHMKG